MNIIETNLSFGSLSTRKSTTRAIIHHAAAKTCGAATIHGWHKNNGWSGIGYHFVVRKDGTVERGRPEHTVGAHATGHNSNSIGICFEGNFEDETMGAAQLQAGIDLLAWLKSKYGFSTVQRHRDVGSTACPGANFPWSELIGGEAPAVTESKPATTVTKASLTVDGLWGKDTTKALQRVLGTTVDGIVSNQYASYKAANPGLLASSWEWETSPGKNGSQMVKALQRRVGATQDGFIGPNTIKALQRYLGTTADGCVSKPSQMVKVLQRKLNAGTF